MTEREWQENFVRWNAASILQKQIRNVEEALAALRKPGQTAYQLTLKIDSSGVHMRSATVAIDPKRAERVLAEELSELRAELEAL